MSRDKVAKSPDSKVRLPDASPSSILISYVNLDKLLKLSLAFSESSSIICCNNHIYITECIPECLTQRK